MKNKTPQLIKECFKQLSITQRRNSHYRRQSLWMCLDYCFAPSV